MYFLFVQVQFLSERQKGNVEHRNLVFQAFSTDGESQRNVQSQERQTQSRKTHDFYM